MPRTTATWIPDIVDLDWIESLAAPVGPALAAIEDAAGRSASRSSTATAAGSCRCWPATGGASSRSGPPTATRRCGWRSASPPTARIVTIDPDRERTDLARGWWREAGIADERIIVVNAPALDAFAAGDPALAGPFDIVFIDAMKPEYLGYLEALTGRLAPGALVVADNVLWSGRASGARPVAADDANTAALRAFDAAVLADPRFTSTILPVGDGLLIATWRG